MLIPTGNGLIFDGALHTELPTGVVLCDGVQLCVLIAQRYGVQDGVVDLERVRLTVENLEPDWRPG